MGDLTGPIVGAVIYSYVGYQATFYAFTVILGIGVFVTIIVLPEQANLSEPQAPCLSDMEKITHSGDVTVFQILQCKTALVVLLCLMCIEVFAFFYEPVLAIRLETGFKMDSDTIGYVFAVAGVSYGVGAILIG